MGYIVTVETHEGSTRSVTVETEREAEELAEEEVLGAEGKEFFCRATVCDEAAPEDILHQFVADRPLSRR